MKILFLSDHFIPEPSAPASHVFERAKIWVAKGYSVTVVTNFPNAPEGRLHDGYSNKMRSREVIDGVEILRVKTFIAPNSARFAIRVLDYLSYALSALVWALLEKRVDVVISTSPHILVPVTGVIVARFKRVPHVFELRDLWPDTILGVGKMRSGFAFRCLEKLELALYRASDRVLAFTPSFKRNLVSRGIQEEKVQVVINGASLDIFEPMDCADAALAAELDLAGKFVLGYLGTVGLAQDLDNLLEAAKLLENPAVRFLIVGAGAEWAALTEKAAAEDLDKVIFVERQPKAQIPRYWSIVDIALVHLKNERIFETVIPSKIFEAMAVGLPVLYVGPESDGSKIVENEDVGMRIGSGNPAALARAADELSRGVWPVDTWRANSRRAAPSYSREKQASDSLDVILDAVRSQEAGASVG